jgi:hypothetical protein
LFKSFKIYFYASEILSFSSLNFFQLSQIKPADFFGSSFSSNNKKNRLEPMEKQQYATLGTLGQTLEDLKPVILNHDFKSNILHDLDLRSLFFK